MNRAICNPVHLDEALGFVMVLYRVIRKQTPRDEGIRLALQHLLIAEEKHGIQLLSERLVSNVENMSAPECDSLAETYFFPFLADTNLIIDGSYGQSIFVRFPTGKTCSWGISGWAAMLASFANSREWKLQELRKWAQLGDSRNDTSKLIWSPSLFAGHAGTIFDDYCDWSALVWEVVNKRWELGLLDRESPER